MLFFALGWNRFFTYQNVSAVKEYIIGFGIIGPLIIIILYSIFNVAMLPTLFFNFLCGYLYGLKYGIILAWVGMTIGLLCSFISSRYIFRSDFKHKFGQNKAIKAIEGYIEKYNGLAVLLFRIIFIFPYNLQNVAYGLSQIKFRTYLIFSALGIIPITVLHVILGNMISTAAMDPEDLKRVFMIIGIVTGSIGTIMGVTLQIRLFLIKRRETRHKSGKE